MVWATVGFGVGLFWLVMAFVFFSGGPSLFVDIVFDRIAVITCPPLFFGHKYFAAPFANALVYGITAVLWRRARRSAMLRPRR
jgi:hypothetical protein